MEISVWVRETQVSFEFLEYEWMNYIFGHLGIWDAWESDIGRQNDVRRCQSFFRTSFHEICTLIIEKKRKSY